MWYRTWCRRGCIPGGYWEGYTGYWEGYTGVRGVLPSQLPGEQTHPAERAPEAQGAGVGGVGAAGALGTVGGEAPGTTLRARSVTLQVPSLSQDP